MMDIACSMLLLSKDRVEKRHILFGRGQPPTWFRPDVLFTGNQSPFNNYMDSNINAKPRFDKIDAHIFLDDLHARLEHRPEVFIKLITCLHLFHVDRQVSVSFRFLTRATRATRTTIKTVH